MAILAEKWREKDILLSYSCINPAHTRGEEGSDTHVKIGNYTTVVHNQHKDPSLRINGFKKKDKIYYFRTVYLQKTVEAIQPIVI